MRFHHGDTEKNGGCTDRVIRDLDSCPPDPKSPRQSLVKNTPTEFEVLGAFVSWTADSTGVLLTKE